MTTSEGAITPAEPDSAITGTVATPANDPRQLELEIERTREQLGETVQELVARVDLVSRARGKASEISDRVKSTTVRARETAGGPEVWMPVAAAAVVIVVGFAALWEWNRRSA